MRKNAYGIAIKYNKIIFFILLVPFILHRYAMNTTLLYWNQIGILTIIILLIYLYQRPTISFDKEAKLYTFFIVTIALPIIIFQVDYTRDIIKYTLYILVYLLVFRKFFTSKRYYDYFINIIVLYFLITIPIYYYDVVLDGGFYKDFYVANMMMPDSYPIVNKVDADFYFPYYLYLVSDRFTVNEMNLLGFKRFFAFGYEPTVTSMVLLPLVFIALDLKKYFSFLILSISIFIVSSYAAILLWLLLMLFYLSLGFKYIKYGFVVLLILVFALEWQAIFALMTQLDSISTRADN